MSEAQEIIEKIIYKYTQRMAEHYGLVQDGVFNDENETFNAKEVIFKHEEPEYLIIDLKSFRILIKDLEIRNKYLYEKQYAEDMVSRVYGLKVCIIDSYNKKETIEVK